MKKLFLAFLSLGMCLSMIGCSQDPKPKDSVEALLKHYKAQEFDELKAFFKNSEVIDESDLDITSELTGLDKDMQTLLLKKLTDIDYKIEKESIKGNKATVKVTITAHNIGSQLKKGINEAMTQAISLAFSDLSEEEIEKKTTETLLSPIQECEKNYTKTVEVQLEKNNKKEWVLSDDNDALINAVSGGLLDFVKDLDDFNNTES